ncbi:expressed protein [Chlorella variabilis]|uniref:Expressed protein n=1 Tax=Chlorella variabilis TaxID=554065 RepID=E1ZRV0_CHLVA|nr:expressed protein [Chlorella variabilis]EFN51525.1 expressed protein [Chlorella variabilis]|eukprot:XP_005843627.1 expressed protein [Chlorella variabilis]
MLEQSRLLFILANQFASQQAYRQAVHCLTAICSQRSELPSVLALARLQLASLLLDRFDNFQEAKALLLIAEQDLRQGHHLLRSEVWDALARCNQKLGAVAAEHKALSLGLKACQQGATSKDEDALAHWRTYFYFKLAEHSMMHEGQDAATDQLHLLDNQGLTHAERVLHLLCRATLHLCACEPTAAAAIVEELSPLIEKAGQGNSLLHKQLRCHYSVLYIAMVVAAGRVNDLKQAHEVVEQQLAQCGIDMEARETQLGVQAIWEGRIFCHLRLLVVEQQVLAALVASRFAQAGELLAELIALLDRFPRHYAHSVQQHAAASAHFQAVLQSDAKHLHDAAAVAAALAELHGSEGPTGLHRAVELLQQRGLTELTHTLSLTVHDRTAALVVNALVAQRSGDDSNARVLLTKALKTAHAHLGSTQMVAQVLNCLAPIQATKGDRAGAEQMLGSATTLGKAQGDLPTLVCSSRALLRIFSVSPDNAQRSSKQREYTERKAGDLHAAVARAAAAPSHATLLAWAPSQHP